MPIPTRQQRFQGPTRSLRKHILKASALRILVVKARNEDDRTVRTDHRLAGVFQRRCDAGTAPFLGQVARLRHDFQQAASLPEQGIAYAIAGQVDTNYKGQVTGAVRGETTAVTMEIHLAGGNTLAVPHDLNRLSFSRSLKEGRNTGGVGSIIGDGACISDSDRAPIEIVRHHFQTSQDAAVEAVDAVGAIRPQREDSTHAMAVGHYADDPRQTHSIHRIPMAAVEQHLRHGAAITPCCACRGSPRSEPQQ